MFHIYDIQKNPDGIAFDKQLELEEDLRSRNPEILALSPVHVKGRVRFESGFFFLDYQMTYQVTLASSRSMEPVLLAEEQGISELFVANERALKEQDMVEEDLVLLVENDCIDLTESVADNILLAIPSKVLTPEEAASQSLPSGRDWMVLTEDAFQEATQERKEASSPFAQLQGLFEED